MNMAKRGLLSTAESGQKEDHLYRGDCKSLLFKEMPDREREVPANAPFKEETAFSHKFY